MIIIIQLLLLKKIDWADVVFLSCRLLCEPMNRTSAASVLTASGAITDG